MRRRGHKRKSEDCNIDKTLQVENKRNLNNLDYEFKEYIEKSQGYINYIENISHILIKKKNFKFGCKNLINHKIYALINAKTCFQLN